MSTLIAILINFLITGLEIQEVPEKPLDEKTEISVEVPEKTTDKPDQKVEKPFPEGFFFIFVDKFK